MPRRTRKESLILKHLIAKRCVLGIALVVGMIAGTPAVARAAVGFGQGWTLHAYGPHQVPGFVFQGTGMVQGGAKADHEIQVCIAELDTGGWNRVRCGDPYSHYGTGPSYADSEVYQATPGRWFETCSWGWENGYTWTGVGNTGWKGWYCSSGERISVPVG